MGTRIPFNIEDKEGVRIMKGTIVVITKTRILQKSTKIVNIDGTRQIMNPSMKSLQHLIHPNSCHSRLQVRKMLKQLHFR